MEMHPLLTQNGPQPYSGADSELGKPQVTEQSWGNLWCKSFRRCPPKPEPPMWGDCVGWPVARAAELRVPEGRAGELEVHTPQYWTVEAGLPCRGEEGQGQSETWCGQRFHGSLGSNLSSITSWL